MTRPLVDGSRGYLPAEPGLSDASKVDDPSWRKILAIYAAAITAQFLFIAWLETF